MKINSYRLRCTECDPSQWVWVEAEKVHISVDLLSNTYVFTAKCPACGKAILNTRPAF